VSRDSFSKVRNPWHDFEQFDFVRVAQHFAQAGEDVVHALPTQPLGEQARFQNFDRMHLDRIERQVAEHRQQVMLQDAGFHRSL
jgi:putative intracellular protease/amidase